jgi:hypothetical protein
VIRQLGIDGRASRLHRQLALDLFEAFGTEEKTLHANMGGHTGVPPFEGTTGTGSSPGT